MKHLTAYRLIVLASMILAGSSFISSVGANADAKPAKDTIVYGETGKKRVHVEGCSRLPADRSGMIKMTFGEAEAKGLPLCSRCPGTTTPRGDKPSTQPTTNPAKVDAAGNE